MHLAVACATCSLKSALFLPSLGRLTRLSSLLFVKLISISLSQLLPARVSRMQLCFQLLLDVNADCHRCNPLLVIVPFQVIQDLLDKYYFRWNTLQKESNHVFQHWPWRRGWHVQPPSLPRHSCPSDLDTAMRKLTKENQTTNGVFGEPLLLINLFQTQSRAIFSPKTPSDWRTVQIQPRLYFIWTQDYSFWKKTYLYGPCPPGDIHQWNPAWRRLRPHRHHSWLPAFQPADEPRTTTGLQYFHDKR